MLLTYEFDLKVYNYLLDMLMNSVILEADISVI